MCSRIITFICFLKFINVANLCCKVCTVEMAEGEGFYVDLQNEFATPDPNAPVLAMLHRMQRDLAELRSQNDVLSSANKEQEKLIRELTSRNSQEGEGSGKRKMDESDEDEAARQ